MIGGTWTCHVCGRERPDDKISVYTRMVDRFKPVVVKENVRYCNDNPECVEGAKKLTWLGADE